MSEQQGPFDLSELAGRIAIVTGAGNNGIGWGICQHAAGVLGMHVVAIDLHETLVRSAEERLRIAFPNVQSLGVQCDVTRPESLEAGLASIRQAMPGMKIGAVFANAGVIFRGSILNSKIEEWETTLNVNVLGAVNTIKTFLPDMQAEEGDSILCTTASVGGLTRGDGGGASYQASKHAVVALTETLSIELARRSPQVRVHVLCPCIVASALMETSRVNQSSERREVAPAEIDSDGPISLDLAMTTENHARQVFDLIAAGKFYLLTDNTRPYVDHDYPFEGLELVKERFENMLDLTIDNSSALTTEPGPRTAILKGEMFKEMKRRAQGDPKDFLATSRDTD